MFHSYSTGVIGKQHEVTAALAAYNDVFNKCQEDICTPFLTKKELTTIINGGDIYISYKDPTLPSRIKRHFK